MKVETVSIKDLISPEYNPRWISDEELRKLKRSIREFGYVRPILVNRVNNHIVGGNQTYKALKQLGYAEVDVVYVTIDDLNKEKALNLALNKINGDFDDAKLEQIFDDLSTCTDFDLSVSGFDDCEIEDLLGDIVGSNVDFDDSVFEDVIIDDDVVDSDSEPERVVVDDSNKKKVTDEMGLPTPTNRSCCDYLKLLPTTFHSMQLGASVSITGLRRDESRNRRNLKLEQEGGQVMIGKNIMIRSSVMMMSLI